MVVVLALWTAALIGWTAALCLAVVVIRLDDRRHRARVEAFCEEAEARAINTEPTR